jgi:starch-binding outer membrane protein, SusD/RagB family
MRTLHIKLLWFGLVVISLGSCNKKLELAPQGTLTQNALLSDSSNVAAFLAGAYLSLWNGCNGDQYLIGDVATGIAQSYSSMYVVGSYDPLNTVTEAFWNNNYATVNLANTVIVSLASNATFSQTLQNQYIAEAKFIRAYSYFNLEKLYGYGALQGQMDSLGVPLNLQPYAGYTSAQNIPRSTNAAVYAQILQDLREATQVLPSGYSTDLMERSHATPGSARALAAVVNLYMGNYDSCNALCDLVLNDPHYALQPSITDVFPNNTSGALSYPFNPEIVFAFPTSYDNYYNDINQLYYMYGYTSISDSFRVTYQQGDVRNTLMFDTISLNGNTMIIPIKFSDPNDRDNLVMIRLPELILDKAEALADLNGVNQTSIDLLNQIHQRAFAPGQAPALYTVSAFPTAQSLINQILQEREWEFALEGHDRFDRIRLGKQPNPLLPASRYALPIPQSEISITGGLIVQNPGY